MLAALAAPSCRDQPPELDDGCFSLDPWEDEREALAEYKQSEEYDISEYDRRLRAIGFCEYEANDVGDILPDYPRTDIDTGWFYCTPATTCEQCVGEDVDQRIREGYATRQDEGCSSDRRGILAYARGCVTESVDVKGEPTCCYSAAIVSECPFSSVPMG